VIGNDLTVTMAAEAGQLQLNAMEPVAAYNILESIRILTNAINTLTRRCVVGIEANADRCAALLEGSLVLATVLAPHIGYDAAARIAKDAQKNGLGIREAAERAGLLSADALWEQGFGVVFPEVAGEPGFADVAATLDLIARLPLQVVVPGHGRPFDDVAGALARARSRLASFMADPARHARHAIKVLLKYHLMEVGSQPHEALLQWALAAPLLEGVVRAASDGGRTSAEALCVGLLDELVAVGALVRAGDDYCDV